MRKLITIILMLTSLIIFSQGKWTDFKEQSKKYSDRMERIQSTRKLEKEQELEKPISRTERLRQARQRGKENEGRTI